MPDRADRDRERASGGFGGDRQDRGGFSVREELPLPTKAPFTAFIGNLAFDLTEPEVEEYFAPHKVSMFLETGEGDRNDCDEHRDPSARAVHSEARQIRLFMLPNYLADQI